MSKSFPERDKNIPHKGKSMFKGPESVKVHGILSESRNVWLIQTTFVFRGCAA